MLKNYIKTAWRNLLRNRLYSLISVLGLAIGITSSLLLLIFVQDELSYDQFHQNQDRLFLITETTHFGDEDSKISRTPYPLAPLLQEKIAGIKAFARVDNYFTRNQYLEFNNQTVAILNASSMGFVDPQFFEMMTFPILDGSIQKLHQPNTMVLSESKAKAYFPNQNPLEKTFLIKDSYTGESFEVEVVAIMQDMPVNSHLQKEFLISMATADNLFPFRKDSWNYASQYSYLLLEEAPNLESINTSLNQIIQSSTSEYVKENYSFELLPISKIYLEGGFDRSYFEVGDQTWVYFFLAISFFILIIASINYLNLATAKAGLRAQEVGLRKVIGADRKQLIIQFLGESTLLIGVSFILSLLLIPLVLPILNELSGKSLTTAVLSETNFIISIAVSLVLTGIIAGAYPAFVLSSFKPILALKGGSVSNPGHRSVILRKGLVVFQFTASIVLIIATITIYKQLDYLKSKPLGFDKENIITLPVQSQDFIQHYPSLKNQLSNQSFIESVTAVNKPVTSRFFDYTTIRLNEETGSQILAFGAVDFNFFETFKINILEGRSFTVNSESDKSQSIIINESAQKLFELNNPLGNTLKIGSQGNPMEIIGVVSDFHFEDLHTPVVPMVFFITQDYFNEIAIRIEQSKQEEALAAIQASWNQFELSEPFVYSFLEEDLVQLYQKEDRFLRLFLIFAVLTILIAFLGTFGLISFTIYLRTKEIGIRKILGASVHQIIRLVSFDFLFLILLGFLIASPIAYLLMDNWVSSFPYQISLNWEVFLYSGLVVLSIGLITVSLQAIKAAFMNPVNSLRSD